MAKLGILRLVQVGVHEKSIRRRTTLDNSTANDPIDPADIEKLMNFKVSTSLVNSL